MYKEARNEHTLLLQIHLSNHQEGLLIVNSALREGTVNNDPIQSGGVRLVLVAPEDVVLYPIDKLPDIEVGLSSVRKSPSPDKELSLTVRYILKNSMK